jgi:hypothetical protein
MQLSTETLGRFKGGQLEIQNQKEDYIYRGEVATVEVVDKSVKVKFAWLAKGKNGFPPDGWINDDNLYYAASTEIYFARELGDGRVVMNSPIVGEIAVFFPPDGSKLDPAKVEGLKLPA